MDPKVNGQIQHDWRWLIAAYLFLGGVGGGAYTIAAINSLMGEAGLSTTIGLWIGFPALAIGSACLLADLGQPTKAVLAGLKPGTSWIARGFWIISIFMILALVHLVMHLAGSEVPTLLPVLGIVFAVGTMSYTGILLSASKGIPFWRSGAVPVVFVISALVTGHFTIMVLMVLHGTGTVGQLGTMALEAAVLVAVEVLAILFFLQAAWKLPDPRESARRILARTSFVVGYFLGGLAAPLALMILILRMLPADDNQGSILSLAALGALLGLVGGLILRHAVLACGALPTLNMAGFEFRRIARPKEVKPGIGNLPPQ